MSARCCEPSTPKVHMIGDRPAMPSSMEAQDGARLPNRLLENTGGFMEAPGTAKIAPLSSQSARLLDVPPLASKEFRIVLNDLRERQEELFRQVLHQQKELQSHLFDMHSTFRETADAHAAWKRHHEDFVSAYRDVSARKTDGEDIQRLPNWVSHVGQGGKWRPQDAEELAQVITQSRAAELANAEAHAVVGEEEPDVEQTSTRDAEERHNQAHNQVKKEFTEQMQTGARRTLEASKQRSICARGDYFLRSKEFELAIAVAILMNAFIMCWEVQYAGLDLGFNLQYPGRTLEAHVVWKNAEDVFNIFDWFFGVLFVCEMVAKLFFWRQKYFYLKPQVEQRKYFHVRLTKHGGSGEGDEVSWYRWVVAIQGYNLLDCFCVAAFLVSKIGMGGAINPQTLRLLRLFRLGRLVRLLRFLETLDHLYVMTTAISGLKEVLAWAIVLLTMMLLTCDLFLVQILHDTYFNEVKASDLTKDQLEKYQEVYQYFGTCTRCMLSMFEITLGNWPPVARLLSEEVSEWFTLICLAHKLTIGFAVIGVITGVILQETFKVAQTDDIIMFRQKKIAACILRKKMNALFDALDDSCDGKVEAAEFSTIAEVPEIKVWLGSLGIETDDLQTLFSLIDVDDNGYITLDELVHRMPRIQGTSRSIDVLAIQRRMWQQSQQMRGSADGPKEKTASFADFLMEPLPKIKKDMSAPAKPLSNGAIANLAGASA